MGQHMAREVVFTTAMQKALTGSHLLRLTPASSISKQEAGMLKPRIVFHIVAIVVLAVVIVAA